MQMRWRIDVNKGRLDYWTCSCISSTGPNLLSLFSFLLLLVALCCEQFSRIEGRTKGWVVVRLPLVLPMFTPCPIRREAGDGHGAILCLPLSLWCPTLSRTEWRHHWVLCFSLTCFSLCLLILCPIYLCWWPRMWFLFTYPTMFISPLSKKEKKNKHKPLNASINTMTKYSFFTIASIQVCSVTIQLVFAVPWSTFDDIGSLVCMCVFLLLKKTTPVA